MTLTDKEKTELRIKDKKYFKGKKKLNFHGHGLNLGLTVNGEKFIFSYSMTNSEYVNYTTLTENEKLILQSYILSVLIRKGVIQI